MICLSAEPILSAVRRLEAQFIEIANRTLDSVNERKVSVDVLKSRLISIRVRQIEQHTAFIEKLWSEANTTSLASIWVKLEANWDYMNYTLLEHLVNKFGDDTLIKDMKQYKKELKDFQGSTSLENFSKYFKRRGGDAQKLSVKFNRKWTESTIKDLESWKIHIAESLSIPQYFMRVQAISEGSVNVIWAIPAMSAKSLMESNKENFVILREKLNIISMSINGTNLTGAVKATDAGGASFVPSVAGAKFKPVC